MKHTKTDDVEGRRISATISEEEFQRYAKLPFGVKNKLIGITIHMILDAYERHGNLFIGAVLGGHVKLEQDLSAVNQEAVRNSNNEIGSKE